jgi:hypothetical protein
MAKHSFPSSKSHLRFVLESRQYLSCAGSRKPRLKEDVPSGTCLSDLIAPFSGMELAENRFGFLLTARVGLKGTSKPVLYKVLMNENNSLTQELLQFLVYCQSFQYPTAPKATRRLLVVQDSKRIEEQTIKSFPCKFMHPSFQFICTSLLPVTILAEHLYSNSR